VAVDRDLLKRLDVSEAVAAELSWRNRLLPRRRDEVTLASQQAKVESWLRPQLKRSAGQLASVVLADKSWRGMRPLHVMTLEDRVLYRALVNLIGKALPKPLLKRIPIDQFKSAPLDVPGVEYITKTDVTSYYEFVDHDLLCAELIAQTGEEPATEALGELLASVMGRRVGLPQVHPSSDVLGDTYIDPVRRRLMRRGHATFTYSDDFRIASPSLGDARAALVACELEIRALGLVLNERKTYTYGKEKYRKSLTAYQEAERRLFEGGQPSGYFGELGFLDDYQDDQEETASLSDQPLRSVDEDEVLTTDEPERAENVDPRRLRAARRAWDLWLDEDESEETQASQKAAITQSLLSKALPILGNAGDQKPLETLSYLLRYEPALTPQIAAYIKAYASKGPGARMRVRRALNQVVGEQFLNEWQGMWLAHVAGSIPRASRVHEYEEWLVHSTATGSDGLAATAAAAMGSIGRGDPNVVSAAIDRLSPAWRRLAFWGLIGLDRAKAESTAADGLDQLLLEGTAS
jgi:hypothetical protein